MRHASLVSGEIDFANTLLRLGSGEDAQMLPGADFGKQEMVLIEPAQAGCMIHEEPSLASQHRNNVGCPIGRSQNRVGDSRSIRRKCRVVFQSRIVGQALGLAVREHFHVDLVGGKERSAAADESEHATIGRQSRSHR